MTKLLHSGHPSCAEPAGGGGGFSSAFAQRNTKMKNVFLWSSTTSFQSNSCPLCSQGGHRASWHRLHLLGQSLQDGNCKCLAKGLDMFFKSCFLSVESMSKLIHLREEHDLIQLFDPLDVVSRLLDETAPVGIQSRPRSCIALPQWKTTNTKSYFCYALSALCSFLVPFQDFLLTTSHQVCECFVLWDIYQEHRQFWSVWNPNKGRTQILR